MDSTTSRLAENFVHTPVVQEADSAYTMPAKEVVHTPDYREETAFGG